MMDGHRFRGEDGHACDSRRYELLPTLRLRHAEARRLPARHAGVAAVPGRGPHDGDVRAPRLRGLPRPRRLSRGWHGGSRRAVRGRAVTGGPARRDGRLAGLVQAGAGGARRDRRGGVGVLLPGRAGRPAAHRFRNVGEPVTHEEAFLADILETPDDDAPRLIFADWLEENGDPDRAEFIRVQVAAARDADPRGKGYLARAGTLLERNWDRWVVPLHRLVGSERYERWLTMILSVARTTAAGRFERGFVSTLSMATARFLEHAEAIHRLQPVTDLSLHGAGGCGAPLAACPSLQW